MQIKPNSSKLALQLLHNHEAYVTFEGLDISAQIMDEASKVVMAVPVFHGGNYIPHSVRECIALYKKPVSGIITTLKVDESQYTVSLVYLGSIEQLRGERFETIFENFCQQAHEWQALLDDKGKQDLIYVRKK